MPAAELEGCVQYTQISKFRKRKSGHPEIVPYTAAADLPRPIVRTRPVPLTPAIPELDVSLEH